MTEMDQPGFLRHGSVHGYGNQYRPDRTDGERSFITSNRGGLRQLRPEDIDISVFSQSDLLCLPVFLSFPFSPRTIMPGFSGSEKAEHDPVCRYDQMQKSGNRGGHPGSALLS